MTIAVDLGRKATKQTNKLMVLCSSSRAIYQASIIISIYYPEVRITVNSDIFVIIFFSNYG